MSDGLYTLDELRQCDMSPRQITEAVRQGDLVRLRRALYCTPELDGETRSALRIGGRLGCLSALRHAGVWVTEATAEVHVHVAGNASRLTDPEAARVHWDPLRETGTPRRTGLLDALLVARRCQPSIDMVASIDSALHQGLVSRTDLCAALPPSSRLLGEVDRRSESGLESLVRVALRRAGLRVEPQVRIDGVGRVDLLVEGAVIVETDGAAFHSGPRRQADYRRDARAQARGLSALRFDAWQVRDELPDVVTAVLGAVCSHRGVRFSGREAQRVRRQVERMRSA